jgi:MSHA biogenesis protein MshG
VAGHVEQLTTSGLPLASGLNAIAEGVPNRRLAHRLRQLSGRIERGQALEQALAELQGLPPYIVGLMQASLRCGDAGLAFADLLTRQQGVQRMWRSIRAEMTYLLLVIGLALGLGLWILLGLVGWFLDDFNQQELELMPATQMLIWMQQVGVWWLLGSLAAITAACLGLRIFGGAAGWRRFLASLPLVGPLWSWSGVTQMSWLLEILLARRVALPEALRLTGGALSDASLGRACRQLADGIEDGQRFSDAIRQSPILPATLVPIVRWGERSEALPEAMRVAGDLFQERVLARGELVNAVVPPILLVGIGAFALALVIGLYTPMYEMMRWMMW